MSTARPALAAKLAGFLFAGGIGFIVDAGTYAGLTLSLALPWLAARPVALFAAIIVTYGLNRGLTFRFDRAIRDPSAFFRYLAASLFGASVNFVVFSAIALLLPSPAQIFAFICGVAAGLAVNFILYDRVVFAQSAH